MTKLENRLLYNYIQRAYEYVRDLGQPQFEGDRKAFVAGLYQSRLNSIFEEPPNQASKPWHFDDLPNRVESLTSQHANRLLDGNMDEFGEPSEAEEIWLESVDRHTADFEKDCTSSIAAIGIDAYATYLPIHFFFESGDDLNCRWGIYISESGIARLAAELKSAFEQDEQSNRLPSATDKRFFLNVAYEILLRHELFHFRIESFALNAELMLESALYVPYLMNVYSEDYGTDDCLEEALANATVLESAKITRIFQEAYRIPGKFWDSIIASVFFDKQPPGYRNYQFRLGDHRAWEGPYTNRSYGSWWGTVRKSRAPERQLAINYLCNLILVAGGQQGHVLKPFFAFLPDNYFLRAENLVPIHIVRTLNPEDSFIRIAPPKHRIFARFLRELGFDEYRDRGDGDHALWKQEGFPFLTVNTHKGEVDWKSFKTSLKTLGITFRDFERYRNGGPLPKVELRPTGAGLQAAN